MNSQLGRRLCLTRWRAAKTCSPIMMCEKNCERKRSRTERRRFFQDGGMLFSSITSSSRKINRLRGSRWKRLPKRREKMVWIVSWIYRSKKISRPALCILTHREIPRRYVKFLNIRLSSSASPMPALIWAMMPGSVTVRHSWAAGYGTTEL